MGQRRYLLGVAVVCLALVATRAGVEAGAAQTRSAAASVPDLTGSWQPAASPDSAP